VTPVEGGTAVFGAVAITWAAQTLRMAIPYVCAGLGGVWSERSGVVNIALEGILLAAGLGAVIAHLAIGSALAGVVAGCLVGAALGALHTAVVVRGRVDAIVSGLAINMLAAGGTRFALRSLYASSSNSPAIAGFPPILRGATGGALLVRTLFDPMTLLTWALVAGSAWGLTRTRFGLRVRASGEDPAASASAGVDVRRVRLLAGVVGGAMAGVGGVALAYDQHRFESGMSGGRGFIALAAVILSGWRPGRLAVACLAFAALDALQIVAQGEGETRTAGGIVEVLPYVATLVALGVMATRRKRGDRGVAPPAALGKPLDG
jgi:simple sugar transport system permease protein